MRHVKRKEPPAKIPGWCDPREPQTERQMACLLGAGMDFDTVQSLTKWEASMCCNQAIQLGRRGEEVVVHRDGPNDTGLIASMFETEMTAKEIIEALRSR